MKRFHVNVGVADLGKSIQFYQTLFGVDPVVRKDDYAKWMLEDPRVNFSISESGSSSGVNHVGLQVDTTDELEEIQDRLHRAGKNTFDQPDAECCYANSSKSWIRDPDSVAWETFVTHKDITHYGNDHAPNEQEEKPASTRCC